MTKVKAIETTDGQIFKDLNAAKQHELALVLRGSNTVTSDSEKEAASAIMRFADEILNVLTMKASSHPAARKANGATRKPRATKAAPAVTKPEAA